MSLLPKTRFQWREPKEFVEGRDSAERAATKWWQGVLGVVVVAAFLMLLRMLATLSPEKDPPGIGVALLLGILLGVFVVYLVPWMIRFCPSEIRLTDGRLVMLRGNRQRSIKWSDLESFCFTGSRGFPALRLRLRGGTELEIGLDKNPRPDELEAFFCSIGIQQTNPPAK